jgi:hypothetical protein
VAILRFVFKRDGKHIEVRATRHVDCGDSQLNTQSEFSFDSPKDESGYTKWVAARQVAAQELARRINLPLGHQVEVWLYGGVRLRGRLRLRENVLLVEEERVRHMELMVEHVAFTYREMESCVRLD